MARAFLKILEKAEKEREKRASAEILVPEITKMSPAQADATRKLTNVGEHVVFCDLCCHGKDIPTNYSHLDKGAVLNVVDFGVQVAGHEGGTYLGQFCKIAKGERFCATGKEKLRKAGKRV